MDKQMVLFAVETENGIVKRIGSSVIAVPEVILQTAGIYNRKISQGILPAVCSRSLR